MKRNAIIKNMLLSLRIQQAPDCYAILINLLILEIIKLTLTTILQKTKNVIQSVYFYFSEIKILDLCKLLQYRKCLLIHTMDSDGHHSPVETTTHWS